MLCTEYYHIVTTLAFVDPSQSRHKNDESVYRFTYYSYFIIFAVQVPPGAGIRLFYSSCEIVAKLQNPKNNDCLHELIR
jgi:hypothetical protein